MTQQGLVSPLASAVCEAEGYVEEQGGSERPWPDGRGRAASLFGPRPIAKGGVAAADAYGVQFPRGTEGLVPSRGNETGC